MSSDNKMNIEVKEEVAKENVSETNVNEPNINETNIGKTNAEEANINETNVNEIDIDEVRINEDIINEINMIENTENNENTMTDDNNKSNNKNVIEENINPIVLDKANNNSKGNIIESKGQDNNTIDSLLEFLEQNKDNPDIKQKILNLMRDNVPSGNIMTSTETMNTNINNKIENQKEGSNDINQNRFSTSFINNTNQNNFHNAEKITNEQNNEHENSQEGRIEMKHKKLVEDNDEYVVEGLEEAKDKTKQEPRFEPKNLSMNNTEHSTGQLRKPVEIEQEAMGLINRMSLQNHMEQGTTEIREVDQHLYKSTCSWNELNIDNELLQVINYQRFFAPSKIQAYALPIILNGNQNLIAQSQNGSGKTLTFVIGMLSKIDRTSKVLQAMCICPTRELAQQNAEVVRNFTKHLNNVQMFLAIPLCDKFDKGKGFQILIGTPGKTLDMLKRKFVDPRNMRICILDEADDLIDIKNNMSSQVGLIRKFLPRFCQILLFSATYNQDVIEFADRFAPNAVKIRVKQEELTLKCVKQYYLITQNEQHKYYYLSELYCSMAISQCVIFVNSKKDAYNLYVYMTNHRHNVTLICADSVISRSTKYQIQKTNVLGMDPKTRDSLMSDFKKGISKVLICTDLLSRGIDVPSVTLVVNFDLPYIYQGRVNQGSMNMENKKVNMETYIHRIGRTGRFGTKGMAINFISRDQLPHIKQIEDYYKCSISDLEFDVELMKTSITKLEI